MIGKAEEEAAVVEDAVVFVVVVRRVSLVHVDVVHAVLRAELGVDTGCDRRVVPVRSEREQLAAAGLQLVELRLTTSCRSSSSPGPVGGSAIPVGQSKSGARE